MGHNDSVTSVAVTGDSKYIVSGSSDGWLRIWGLGEKRFQNIFSGFAPFLTSLAMTRNDKFIVCCYEGKSIRIWKM